MRLTISAEKEKEEGWGGEESRPRPSQGCSTNYYNYVCKSTITNAVFA